MASDFWIVLQWWGSLFLVGALAWPLTKRLFASWFDQGYFFSKAVGFAAVTWIVYVLGTLRVMPFSVVSIGVALGMVLLLGLGLNKGDKGDKGWKRRVMVMVLEELFFLAALLFWSWIKGHEPSIRGLEKFMDFGFMQSILNSQYFPPADMWYAGQPVNYYYFGHMVVAILTKLSGLDLAYTFNLMLATLFSLTLTMAFSIGAQLFRLSSSYRRMNHEFGIMNHGKEHYKTILHNSLFMILSGTLTSFLVTMAGNLQTIYAFTRGYTGENVKPFWELAWPIAEFWKRLQEGMNTYWYANATRFIPYTIHEFPGYSFVVSDVHGHVLSIPFVLLAIALLITLFVSFAPNQENHELRIMNYEWIRMGFYGFLAGVLLMTNALDGPIYLALFFVLFILHNSRFIIQRKNIWKPVGLYGGEVTLIAGVTSLPFLVHFKSFVTGLAINCPLAGFANTKFGPIIFEGVEKCQISPLWMWWLLWGFFIYCGMGLIGIKIRGIREIREIRVETLLIIFFLFALALVIFPEFFYFKDIYPMHFRSNTMFKLGYQAFILFSIVAGYTIVAFANKARMNISNRSRILFFIFLLPQLILVSIFPIFAVRSYFGELKKYEGIYGLGWLAREYPTDFSAIEWLNSRIQNTQREALVEADGDSYTDYARFSAFTGIPTIVGWPVHEWLWRGTYDVVAPRREEVRQVYESENLEMTRMILVKYGVRYIIVGKMEREKYKSLQETKFEELGSEVFRSGDTVIYEVKSHE